MGSISLEYSPEMDLYIAKPEEMDIIHNEAPSIATSRTVPRTVSRPPPRQRLPPESAVEDGRLVTQIEPDTNSDPNVRRSWEKAL